MHEAANPGATPHRDYAFRPKDQREAVGDLGILIAGSIVFDPVVTTMWYYAVRRTMLAIPIAIGVTIICFCLVYLAPGDPVQNLLPPDATQADVTYLKHAYGLDQPVPIQYVKWLLRALSGDFGMSIQTNRPVLGEVLHALTNTLFVSIGAVTVAFPLALLLGTVAAYYVGRAPDRIATSLAVIGISVPGTGFLLNKAILTRDIPMLQGAMLVLALWFVVINLVVDLLQTAIDPRIKRG